MVDRMIRGRTRTQVPSRKRDVDGVCVSSFPFERLSDSCHLWKLIILGTLGVPSRVCKTSKERKVRRSRTLSAKLGDRKSRAEVYGRIEKK